MSLRLSNILPWILLGLTVAGCTRGIEDGDIRDVVSLKQDCLAYLDSQTADKPLIEPDHLSKLNDEFRRQWTMPWDPKCQPPDVNEVAKTFARFEASPGFGENFQPHTASFANELRKMANLETYPSRVYRAITIRNTNLRYLPTHWPRFNAINKAGEGFPFDSLQETALWAGTPLLVCHESADRQWLLVESNIARGWLPAQDVAAIDDETVRTYQNSPLVALIKDNASVIDAESDGFLFATHIGAVFPLATERLDSLEVFVPSRDADGKAKLRRAILSKTQAAVIPLNPTPATIAAIASQMLGQPYGWGGMYEGRDCSATTRDLMTPFGIWLPRNSSAQARAYRSYSLKDMTGRQKERLIIEKGVPFLTLVRVPDHIALYIGSCDGRAIVMHNFWGVRTRRDGLEGRKIVGRCVITTVQPGIELVDIDGQLGDWRNRIESIVFIGMSKDQPASAP